MFGRTSRESEGILLSIRRERLLVKLTVDAGDDLRATGFNGRV